MGGIATIGEGHCAEREERLHGRNKKQRAGLSLLVATVVRFAERTPQAARIAFFETAKAEFRAL